MMDAGLIAPYRSHTTPVPARAPGAAGVFARIGAATAALPSAARDAFDFSGRHAVAMPTPIRTPPSVDWRSVPALVQSIGADAVLVTAAANLLIGFVVGLLAPGLGAVSHAREIGALVTVILVAGRSGAGLASEIATMKVSEEIDALRWLGFDPVRWLVVPRCLALVIVLPILTWIGDGLALAGGFLATMAATDLSPRAFAAATATAITRGHLAAGLVTTPFLALAIGLVACGQGLAAHGGAAAIGARTSSAVVRAIVSVIAIDVLFALLFVMLGI